MKSNLKYLENQRQSKSSGYQTTPFNVDQHHQNFYDWLSLDVMNIISATFLLSRKTIGQRFLIMSNLCKHNKFRSKLQWRSAGRPASRVGSYVIRDKQITDVPWIAEWIVLIVSALWYFVPAYFPYKRLPLFDSRQPLSFSFVFPLGCFTFTLETCRGNSLALSTLGCFLSIVKLILIVDTELWECIFVTQEIREANHFS